MDNPVVCVRCLPPGAAAADNTPGAKLRRLLVERRAFRMLSVVAELADRLHEVMSQLDTQMKPARKAVGKHVVTPALAEFARVIAFGDPAPESLEPTEEEIHRLLDAYVGQGMEIMQYDDRNACIAGWTELDGTWKATLMANSTGIGKADLATHFGAGAFEGLLAGPLATDAACQYAATLTSNEPVVARLAARAASHPHTGRAAAMEGRKLYEIETLACSAVAARAEQHGLALMGSIPTNAALGTDDIKSLVETLVCQGLGGSAKLGHALMQFAGEVHYLPNQGAFDLINATAQLPHVVGAGPKSRSTSAGRATSTERQRPTGIAARMGLLMQATTSSAREPDSTPGRAQTRSRTPGRGTRPTLLNPSTPSGSEDEGSSGSGSESGEDQGTLANPQTLLDTSVLDGMSDSESDDGQSKTLEWDEIDETDAWMGGGKNGNAKSGKAKPGAGPANPTPTMQESLEHIYTALNALEERIQKFNAPLNPGSTQRMASNSDKLAELKNDIDTATHEFGGVQKNAYNKAREILQAIKKDDKTRKAVMDGYAQIEDNLRQAWAVHPPAASASVRRTRQHATRATTDARDVEKRLRDALPFVDQIKQIVDVLGQTQDTNDANQQRMEDARRYFEIISQHISVAQQAAARAEGVRKGVNDLWADRNKLATPVLRNTAQTQAHKNAIAADILPIATSKQLADPGVFNIDGTHRDALVALIVPVNRLAAAVESLVQWRDQIAAAQRLVGAHKEYFTRVIDSEPVAAFQATIVAQALAGAEAAKVQIEDIRNLFGTWTPVDAGAIPGTYAPTSAPAAVAGATVAVPAVVGEYGDVPDLRVPPPPVAPPPIVVSLAKPKTGAAAAAAATPPPPPSQFPMHGEVILAALRGQVPATSLMRLVHADWRAVAEGLRAVLDHALGRATAAWVDTVTDPDAIVRVWVCGVYANAERVLYAPGPVAAGGAPTTLRFTDAAPVLEFRIADLLAARPNLTRIEVQAAGHTSSARTLWVAPPTRKRAAPPAPVHANALQLLDRIAEAARGPEFLTLRGLVRRVRAAMPTEAPAASVQHVGIPATTAEWLVLAQTGGLDKALAATPVATAPPAAAWRSAEKMDRYLAGLRPETQWDTVCIAAFRARLMWMDEGVSTGGIALDAFREFAEKTAPVLRKALDTLDAELAAALDTEAPTALLQALRQYDTAETFDRVKAGAAVRIF